MKPKLSKIRDKYVQLWSLSVGNTHIAQIEIQGNQVLLYPFAGTVGINMLLWDLPREEESQDEP